MRWVVPLAAVAVLLLASLSSVPAGAEPKLPVRARAVVAIIGEDTNPYHDDFAEPRQTADPATYLPGYPAGAVPLDLHLGGHDYQKAKALDSATWAAFQPGQLYYVPGTNIVGIMSFGASGLDEGGHGTGTSSLATGNLHGMAPDADVVLVSGDLFAGIAWAAAQPWIDVLSISLGGFLGTCTLGETCHPEAFDACTGNPMLPVHWVHDLRLAHERGAETFAAASYGCGFTLAGGAAGSAWPGQTVTSFFSGPSWTVTVGTFHPDREQGEFQGAYPVEVLSKASGYTAASAMSTSGENEFGHASGAVPLAAGIYASILQHARQALGDPSTAHAPGIVAQASAGAALPAAGPLADGVFTQAEAEQVFFHAARPVDAVESYQAHGGGDPQAWAQGVMPAPPAAEFLTEGYGLVDGPTRDAADAVLDGSAPAPLRLQDDAWELGTEALRDAVWVPIDETGLYVL